MASKFDERLSEIAHTMRTTGEAMMASIEQAESMKKLDALKEKLLTLQPGEEMRVLQPDAIEAVESDRRHAYEYPSARIRFGEWCEENGFAIRIMPADDYIVFEKRAANA